MTIDSYSAAMQPEDSRCPPTYRREGAVTALIDMGWQWNGIRWVEPTDDGHCAACDGEVCTAKPGCVTCSYRPATLRQNPERGVTVKEATPNDDAGHELVIKHHLFVHEFDFGDEGKGRYVRLGDFNKVVAALEAALSAQQGQGEACRECSKAMTGLCAKCAEEQWPHEFGATPPAQPAEPSIAEIRAAFLRMLERGNHRTDGDMSKLMDRLEHMVRGDQDCIAAQRMLLDDLKARQPAERVPEGWVLVPSPPANCRQRLMRDGKPYPRSSCQACGKWSPKATDCDALLAAACIAASPAPSPARGDGGEE